MFCLSFVLFVFFVVIKHRIEFNWIFLDMRINEFGGRNVEAGNFLDLL